ncbi:MAG: hypothetical protein LAT51_09280 [Flavobacteriaceae bacterium]|nr:hypothetical protein [Flavobacteriaceae bacterium]
MKQPTNNWKKEMLQREIQPSDEVWLKVAKGLQQPKSKINKKRIVIGLVAAAIMALLIIPMFLIEKTTNTSKNSIVTEEKIENVEKTSIEERNINKKSSSTEIQQENKVALEDKKTSVEESKSFNSAQEKKISNVNSDEVSNQSAEISKEKEEVSEPSPSKDKATTLLAEVEAEIDKENIVTTDREVENLLAQAEQKIDQANYNKLMSFAEAHELLAEVEEDLSKNDLKEKIFKFLKNNLKEIESAIVGLK